MSNEIIEATLIEFLQLYRVVNREKISKILSSELRTEQDVMIYRLSDGKRSTRDISNEMKSKCSHATVAAHWNRWAAMGLVIPTNYKGRYRAAFDLSFYDISNTNDEKEL